MTPPAVRVMHEAGMDMAVQYSKRLDDLLEIDFDYVVTARVKPEGNRLKAQTKQ